MPTAKRAAPRAPKRLGFKDVSYAISYKPRNVTCSDDVQPSWEVIGQDRAIEAIRIGLSVPQPGYNIFVTGMSGTGRTTTIRNLLERLDHETPQLHDVAYVNNFKDVDRPRCLIFAAGDGRRFKKDMDYLISSIRQVVPKIFLSEDYKDRHTRLVREFESRQKKLIAEFEGNLTEAGFVMVQIQSNLGIRNEIQPLVDGEPVALDKLEGLVKEGKFSAPQLDEFRRVWDSLRREFDTTTVESKKLGAKLEEAIEKLNLSMVAPLVTDKINLVRRRYPDEKTATYLDEVEEALTSDLDRYREAQAQDNQDESPALRRREPFEEFSVNLVLDNAESTAVPIISEKSPSHKNLFGSLERVVDRHGYWRTDFTRIHGGSLLRAAGGFLVINALDLLTEPGTWTPLKRALRNGEIEVQAYDPFYMMAGSGIKPEPIPLTMKVVLIGEAHVYRLLWNYDEDFKKIFKIKSEFDSTMPLNKASVEQYYRYICRVVEEEQLPTFALSGMQAVAEYGRRLSGDRDKLSVRFMQVADIVREAAFFARTDSRKQVTRDHVERAIISKRRRVNMVEDKIQEMFDEDVLMVDTTGHVVGQINGLSVYNLGEYSFGRPTRITVSTSLGKAGIINIEREADLSGPIHNKGVQVLSGWLRQMFAQDKPLVLSASIAFEQSYSGVDGDSASSTEIFALLSSLTGIPIDQGIAVTGSVNQHGQIQPIGGVNEKVEGFFDVCEAKGLTGKQGVIFPVQNQRDLLLRSDVIEAVKKKTFHLYPIETVEQGIEILTGVGAGKRLVSGGFTKESVLGLADDKLRDMALSVLRFGQPSRNGDKDKEKAEPKPKRSPAKKRAPARKRR